MAKQSSMGKEITQEAWRPCTFRSMPVPPLACSFRKATVCRVNQGLPEIRTNRQLIGLLRSDSTPNRASADAERKHDDRLTCCPRARPNLSYARPRRPKPDWRRRPARRDDTAVVAGQAGFQHLTESCGGSRQFSGGTTTAHSNSIALVPNPPPGRRRRRNGLAVVPLQGRSQSQERVSRYGILYEVEQSPEAPEWSPSQPLLSDEPD